jgi:hypothetical protein
VVEIFMQLDYQTLLHCGDLAMDIDSTWRKAGKSTRCNHAMALLLEGRPKRAKGPPKQPSAKRMTEVKNENDYENEND